ncbi:Uncharacterized protein conserved in bacteria DUF195 [Elusimicrobium minutum Pei191]|uniref:Uncharacterized protein conserved in bacteria DUF195 n=1 Tax=Elusimicrobium minutum (strain Pei191) TaxID=445932 RepID=B2KBD1_ELUMP|nr:DNA recombination protein RmuC [Elusimicrobium minutum]ACC97953.1 Uncharacterized protein conserved in bacteria DUF195 [Elusimicrobium minutum Pei191]
MSVWILVLIILIVAAACFFTGYLLADKKAAFKTASLEVKLSEREQNEERLVNTFKALSAEALNTNNKSFLELAKTTLEKYQESAKGDLEKRQQAINSLVEPVKETLGKFEVKIGEIEKERKGAYEGLKEQMHMLLGTTQTLSNALTSSSSRGRWGELQLKKIVELAGMMNHADFVEQSSVSTQDGRLRPDLIVKLPGGSNIVVDSKAPVSKYLEAVELKDPSARHAKFKEFAAQIKDHIKSLSSKAYWEQFSPTPDFVVLFIPGDSYFAAALEAEPALIENAVKEKVIVATPTTLISLLKAIAYGWRNVSVEQDAKEIAALGKELYERIATMSEHFYKIGSGLENATKSYNQTLRSYESRVLVSARRFKDFKVSDKEIDVSSEHTIDVLPNYSEDNKKDLLD